MEKDDFPYRISRKTTQIITLINFLFHNSPSAIDAASVSCLKANGSAVEKGEMEKFTG